MSPISYAAVAHREPLQVFLITFEHRLNDAMARLLASVESFLADVGDTWTQRELPDMLRLGLLRLEESLKNGGATGWHAGTVLVYAEDCLAEFGRFNGKHVKRELFRNLRRSCREVVGLGRAIDAMHCLGEVRDLELQTRTVMEILRSDIYSEPVVNTPVDELVSAACSNQRQFALERGIDFRIKGKVVVSIEGRKRDLVRIISNILNNAIKYSYLMHKGRAWVNISSRCAEGILFISVENWGVPIPRDEIEDGSLVRFGQRGSLAGRSGFGGHGIGLADAKRIAEAHSGKLTIESRPADHSDLEPDYSKPFLTTVILSFPLASPA